MKTLQALAVTLVLSGVPASVQAQTLELWTMQLSPHLDAYVKGVIADFEQQNPGVKIKWVDLPWSEMERKVLTAIAAKQPPDVVNLNPQFAAKLAEFRALADPGAHLPPDVRARYLPAAWAANQLEGRTFALPWYVTTNLTLVNKGLLTRAGVAVPKTHRELLAMAPALRSTGAYAYFPALDGSHPLETLVSMGAPLVGHCGAGFVNQQGAEVMDFYRQLYQRGWVPRNVVTEGHRKAVELFVAGEVAVVSTGMQFLQAVKSGNSKLYAQIDVAPPLTEAGVPPNLAVMNLAVPELSTQRALAFRLAAHITSDVHQLAFARTVPVLPSTRASYQDPFLSTTPASEALIDRARALSAASALSGAVLVPPMRQYSKLRTSYSLQLQAQMLGRSPPLQALQTVGRQWASLMGCAP
jgi:putative chitobiose transport system substrate-binding protein